MSCKLRNALAVPSDGANAIAGSLSSKDAAPAPAVGSGVILVGGLSLPAPPGLRVESHDALFGFKDRTTHAYRPIVTSGKVNRIILHQSQTRSRAICEVTLKANKLGTHFAVDPDGLVHQYGDALIAQYAHGQECNKTSIGIEEINPYSRIYPPWTSIVSSKTANRGREVVSTTAAVVAIANLVLFLTTLTTTLDEATLSIPLSFPTTPSTGPVKTSSLWYTLTVGGIFAHGHRPPLAGERGHADARRTAWMVRQHLEQSGIPIG